MTRNDAQAHDFSRGSSNIRAVGPATMESAAGLAVTGRGGLVAVGTPAKRQSSDQVRLPEGRAIRPITKARQDPQGFCRVVV